MRHSQAEDRRTRQVETSSTETKRDEPSARRPGPEVQYPGIEAVIHGNGAVAHVMGHVCGGVIGFPITPSTEISELFEAYRAKGGCNVWGKHPFFFEPEGEHSAQSGAMGATLTGGRFISNASSSQGILYGLESHYVTVGKKAGGFVLQVAARAVSRIMAQPATPCADRLQSSTLSQTATRRPKPSIATCVRNEAAMTDPRLLRPGDATSRLDDDRRLIVETAAESGDSP
mgnify:CR=1 FL=1